MSCGTKIEGRFYSWSEREELAERLEREGEPYRVVRAVRHGDCLDDGDARRAERALESQGLSRHFDYRKTKCHCSTDEEY
jgi:hypothetical protein